MQISDQALQEYFTSLANLNRTRSEPVTMKSVELSLLASNGGDQPTFDVVCYDEAQCLHNPKSTTARIAALIPKLVMLMMTATPLLNKIEDIHGFA